jgi:hypothetical protein
MALILAIEPDRRQAAQLARLIQTRVGGAELVLAETTEQALGAIGNRVPDLVLVPALLAPQDDATLAAALRVIAAAAHVQMLTIPVLAPAGGARQPLGVLARLRRKRPEPQAPNGCDPNVFGDQIAAYLAEAAAERAINESDLEIERSTSPTRSTKDSKDPAAFSQDSPDLSVHTVLGTQRALEAPPADEPPLAAAERFIVAEADVDLATIEPHLEISTVSTDPSVHVVLRDERVGQLDELTAPPIAPAEAFSLTQRDAERAIIGFDFETATTKDTKDSEVVENIGRYGPDLGVHRVLDGERAEQVEELTAPPIAAAAAVTLAEAVDDIRAVIEEVELAAVVDLVASSGEVPAALLGVSKLSEAPWFGAQRRWPDIEGQETVDQLTLSDSEDAAELDVHPEFLPAAVLASIDAPPTTLLAAMDDSAEVVVEEMLIEAQSALPAIGRAPLEEPAPDAVVELWMPLSSGSTRSWPMLEGVWSEARPDPPVKVHADPPAVATAPPAPIPVPAPVPAAARMPPPDAPAARPEWIELIESLRQDVQRLRTERTQAAAVRPRAKETPIPVSRPLSPLPPAAVANMEMVPRKRARAAKPAQDEWGFFDPEQCGFAALLAKLDEITDVTDGA